MQLQLSKENGMLRKKEYWTQRLIVLAVALGFAVPAAASMTATLTVGGSEQQINGAWDQSSITLSFNNFSETVTYGQFSSAASIASALAAMFSRDYAAQGLSAKASCPPNTTAITFTLQGTATFGVLSIGDPTGSFQVSSASGWTSVSTAGGSGPVITQLSLSEGPAQMGLVITGTNFGSTPSVALNGAAMTVMSASPLTVQVPNGATIGNGNIVVTVNGTASNTVPFKVDPAFGCN